MGVYCSHNLVKTSPLYYTLLLTEGRGSWLLRNKCFLEAVEFSNFTQLLTFSLTYD